MNKLVLGAGATVL